MPSDEVSNRPSPRSPSPARSSLQTFVHRQNLTLYVDQLEQEHEPDRRDRLKTLLLEEEDRYGSRRERFERADLLVRRAQARLIRQRTIVAELATDGRDTTIAERTLFNMIGLIGLFERYRDVLRDAMDRSGP